MFLGRPDLSRVQTSRVALSTPGSYLILCIHHQNQRRNVGVVVAAILFAEADDDRWGSNCAIMLRHAGSAPSVAPKSNSQQTSGDSSSQAHLFGLAEAAQAGGDVEVAYLLYAKGTTADTSKGSRFTAGMLHSLAALCQPPTAAAAAAVPKRWQQMQQRLFADSLGAPLRQTAAAPTTPAFSKSHSIPALAGAGPPIAHSSRVGRRVFCASDLHVDRAGGANMAWLKSISSSSFRHDVLIVAGECCLCWTASRQRSAAVMLIELF